MNQFDQAILKVYYNFVAKIIDEIRLMFYGPSVFIHWQFQLYLVLKASVSNRQLHLLATSSKSSYECSVYTDA